MNIQPYDPDINFWSASIIQLIFLVMFLGMAVAGFYVLSLMENARLNVDPLQPKSDDEIAETDQTAGLGIAVGLFGLIGFIVTLIILFAGGGVPSAKIEGEKVAYKVAEQTLNDNGFSVITGKFSLTPDSQGSIVLEYKGNPWDCKVYTPKDSTKDLIFSCGETNSTLNDIKQKK